jgi:uncharacterized protein YlxW (UPF0749 family)
MADSPVNNDDIRDLANYVEGYKHASEDALPHLVAQNKQLVEENERLRARVDYLAPLVETNVRLGMEADAEIERLRAALKRIAGVAGNRGDHAIAIALEALDWRSLDD